MKQMIIHVILLSGLCSCGDPGVITKPPLKFLMADPFHQDSSQILTSLEDLILGAKKSIECAFSDLDTGYVLDLKSRSTPVQNMIYKAAQNILNKRNAGVDLTLVFDIDKKCISNGALFFQYPGFFEENYRPLNRLAAYSHKDLLKDCNLIPGLIPHDEMQAERQKGLQENREIFFVNPSGDMSDNVCIFDHKTVWYSQNALTGSISNRPAVSFILNAGGSPMVDEFSREISLLKSGLTGTLKKPDHNMVDYSLYDSTWHIIRGPQDNPPEYLARLLDSAKTLHLYTSGFDFDPQNPFVNSLLGLLNTENNINLLFADTGIYSQTSFYQRFFIGQNYCVNRTDFCSRHFGHLDLRPGFDNAHFFLIRDQNGNKKTVLYNGDLDPVDEKNADSILIEITSSVVYDLLLQSWITLSDNATGFTDNSANRDLPQPGDVAITELVWMGSVDNLRNTHTSDEAVELYNSTTHTVDIGGIVIACTASLNGDTVDSFFEIPPGVILTPSKYFSIASRQNGAFFDANMVLPGLAISNSTRECLVVDNRTPAMIYYPPGSVNGHYNDVRLHGVILDYVLNFTGDPWNLYASDFFSKTGLNTTRYGVDGEGARSMEKISPNADGKLLQNWHMNTFTPLQNITGEGYIFHTFSSLGFENSPFPQSADGSVVVSEIHWMGSYDQFGVSYAADEFVEFYNRSSFNKNIGGWIFGCSTNVSGSAGKPLFAIPYGLVIKPGQYLVIGKTGAKAFLNIDFALDFTLNNSITQCLLTDGNYGETVFQGSDANGDGLLSGHYDSALFSGSVVDAVSDRSSSFSALGLGLNNTAGNIRRSCERIDMSSSGDSPLNWKANSMVDPVLNSGVYFDFRSNTFATPGLANSN